MAFIHQVNKFDLENDFGRGPVVSVFTNFCSFHCKNCWNSETWDRKDELFIDNNELAKMIIDYLEELKSRGMKPLLSYLGGDPIVDENIDDTFEVIQRVKESVPEVQIAIWTGFEIDHTKFETNSKRMELLKLIDILIDGQFIEKLKTKNQMFGSFNQRVINTKKYYQTKDVFASLDKDYLNTEVIAVHTKQHFKIKELVEEADYSKRFYWLNLIPLLK